MICFGMYREVPKLSTPPFSGVYLTSALHSYGRTKLYTLWVYNFGTNR